MGPPAASPGPRRYRRFLLGAMLVGLAAAAVAAGLARNRARRAADAVARLRSAGAGVSERVAFPDWWLKLPQFARGSPLKDLVGRNTCDVVFLGKATTADDLHSAARHPDLYALRVYDAPAIDDEALAALSACTGVEILELHNTRVTDAGLRHLGGWARLKSVTVRGSRVSDEGLHFVCALPSVGEADYETTAPAEAVVRDLSLADEEGPRPEAGKPWSVGGRLKLSAARARAGGPVVVGVDLSSWGHPHVFGSVSVVPDAGGEAVFCVRVQDRLSLWTVPRQVAVAVTVGLPGRPRVTYRLPPVALSLEPKARPPQGDR